MLVLHPVWVIGGGDGGLEAGGWLFFFFGYQDEYLFWLFHTLVSTELALCLSQFCPHVNRGFLSFSKRDFRLGRYRPRFSGREAGETGGPSEIGRQMESGVILTPLVGRR